MKKIFLTFIIILFFAVFVNTVSQPFNYQGKEYYVVTSTDPSEDTGGEVCAKVGKTCVGYTVNTTDVCKYFHSDATTSSSLDGDKSGVYCDGSPQTGVCAAKSNTCHTCPQCSNTVDCSTPIGNLYREMYVECSGGQSQTFFLQDFFSSIAAFFSNLFKSLFSFGGQNQIAGTVVTTTQIGPYPGMYACDFYQIPFPGVNKKHVSCPYETPGAAINDAANAFCRTSMGSAFAKAEICNNSGIIVCTHPCDTTPPTIMPTRCAFDNDRPRGNQAAPLDWCPPKEPVFVPSGEGRPDNCDDTAYQAHPGYNENQALWDSYAADTDGVCQTRFGTGTPSSPCAHTVQVSVQGNPYYLCWYNN